MAKKPHELTFQDAASKVLADLDYAHDQVKKILIEGCGNELYHPYKTAVTKYVEALDLWLRVNKLYAEVKG